MEKERKYSDTRVGVIGIILNDPQTDSSKVNSVLHEYSDIIVGRMGIPYRQKGIAVIALTVDGTTDEIGAMTGKLGQIPEVTVKSALAPKEK